MSVEDKAVGLVFKVIKIILFVLWKMKLIVPAIVLILLNTVWLEWSETHETLSKIVFATSLALSLLAWLIKPVRNAIQRKREKDYIKVTEENNQLMERMLLEEHLKKVQQSANEKTEIL